MKLLLFGKRSAQLAELAKALKPLNPTAVRLAENWEAVESGVREERPDLAVLCMSQLLAEGVNLVSKAQIYLIEQGVPTIVAISADAASEKLVAQEYFSKDAIVESPYDPGFIEEKVRLAITKGRVDQEPEHKAFDEEWTEVSFLAESRAQADSAEDVSPRATFLGRYLTRLTREKQALSADRDIPPPQKAAGGAQEMTPPDETSRRPEKRSRHQEVAPAGPSRDHPEPSDSTDASSTSTREEPQETRTGPLRSTSGFQGLVGRKDRPTSAVRPEPAPPAGLTPSPGADPIQAIYATLSGSEKEGEPVRFTPGFPSLLKGQIDQASPLRVLYGLSLARASGQWILTRGNLRKEFTYLEGEVGLLDVTRIDASRKEELTASLLWSSGVYLFRPQSVPKERFVSLGNVLELMHDVVHRGLRFDDVAEALGPFFHMVPVLTSRVLNDSALLARLPGIVELLGSCRGSNLETIVSARPALAESAMKNALFCFLIDAISFWDSPLAWPVEVEYDMHVFQVIGDRSSADWESAAEEEISPEEEALLVELAARATDFQARSPYEVFGLPPGCGREAVEEVYYRLVKEHHPDVYALARSPSAKPLAEMVFRQIRDAFRVLLEQEKSRAQSASIRKKTARPIPLGPTQDEWTADRSFSGAPPSVQPAPGDSPRATFSTSTRSSAGQKPFESPVEEGQSPFAASTEEGPPEPERPFARGRREPSSRSYKAVGETGSRPQVNATVSRRSGGTTGSFQTIRATVKDAQQIQISPRQHFKNGLSLLTSGVTLKAAESFRLAHAGEQNNGTYLAYSVWSSYLVDKIASKEAISLLKAGLDDLEEKEYLALFLGQILMSEGQKAKAVNYFNKCLEYNPNNIEAIRQIRLHQMRHGKKGEGLLDKLLSLRGPKGKDKKS